MLRSPFIEINPRGTTPLEVGVRDLSRFGGLTYRPCLRGLKATTATELGQTDGRFGYYNLENINKRKPSEAAYVVGHENKHINYNHVARFRPFEGARIYIPFLSKEKTWDACNTAGDLIINIELVEENEAAKLEMRRRGINPYDIMTPIDGCFINIKELYDNEREDLSSEQLVEKLLKKFPVPPIEIGNAMARASAAPESEDSDEEEPCNGNPASGSAEPSDEGGEASTPSSSPSPQPTPDASAPAGDGGVPSKDESEDETKDTAPATSGKEDDKADEEDSKGKDAPATSGEFGGGHNDFREPELDEGETLEEFDAANKESTKKATFEDRLNEVKGVLGSGAGSKVDRDLARISDPVPWAYHLIDWFSCRDEAGWNRPFCIRSYNRTGIVRRARGSEVAGELAFVVDTSGSNIDRIPEMIVKIQEALDEFNPKAVHVIPIDTRVHETTTVYAGGALPDFLGGGGGTHFLPAFNWVEENCPWIDGLIYLTDGHATDWTSLTKPDYPVLWLDYGYHKPEDIGTTKFHFGERIPITLGKKVSA